MIRTAAVRVPDVGYIYAASPEKEDEGHAVVFRWTPEAMKRGKRGFDAHSVVVVTHPDVGYVDMAASGTYTITISAGLTRGDIIDDSSPPPAENRHAGFRALSAVEGKAYAVGLRGMVYRLEQPGQWRRLDDGLPDTFDVQALHGFAADDLYAVGHGGALWTFDGGHWHQRELPTNVNLTSVKCAGDGQVYIGGHDGMLLEGRADHWTILDPPRSGEDLWDIDWFEGRVYVSSLENLYVLDGRTPRPVDVGPDKPETTYQLSVGEGVMWSTGEHDIMAFDGKRWTRVV